MDYSNFIPVIAGWLHITPSTLAALIPIIILVSKGISRRIPSDATGVLGIIRSVCAFIGIEVENRVTSGVTTSDVTKTVLSFPEAQAKIDEAKK